MRTHLQRAARNTGEVDPLLKVDWPSVGYPLWRAFCEMGRPPAVSGLAEITSQEILAYQQIEGVSFTSWELSIIRMFDKIALESAHKQQSKSP